MKHIAVIFNESQLYLPKDEGTDSEDMEEEGRKWVAIEQTQ